MRLSSFVRTRGDRLTIVPPTTVQSNPLRVHLALFARMWLTGALILGVVLGPSWLPASPLATLLLAASVPVGLALVFLVGNILLPHVHTVNLLGTLDHDDLAGLNRLAETVPGGADYRDAVWAMGRPFHHLDLALLQMRAGRSEKTPSLAAPPTLAGKRSTPGVTVMAHDGTLIGVDPTTRILRLPTTTN